MNGAGSAGRLEVPDFSLPHAFIFDLDGTLLDSDRRHLEAFQQALGDHAPEWAHRLTTESIKGRGSHQVLEQLGLGQGVDIADVARRKRLIYLDLIREGRVRPFPGALDLIRFLRLMNRTLIIVTGSSRQSATAALSATGLLEYFDHIISAEQAHAGKPDPALFLCALRAANLAPDHAITIEDALIGVRASRAAGIEAVLVNRAVPTDAAVVFPTVADLGDRIISDFARNRVSLAAPVHSTTHGFLDLVRLADAQRASLRVLYAGAPSRLPKTALARWPSPPPVWILLSDPDSPAFLRLVDKQNSTTWQAWEAREAVRTVAHELLANSHDPASPSIRVGLCAGDLTWNMAMLGDEVLLDHQNEPRSESRPGWTAAGKNELLARSFLAQWEAATHDRMTRWPTMETLRGLSKPKWPGLFKSNAVSIYDDQNCVRKVCGDDSAHAAETAWLRHAPALRGTLEYFRPVLPAPGYHHDEATVFGRIPLRMQRVQGASLFDLACLVNEAGQRPGGAREAAAGLLRAMLLDSLASLSEFRAVADRVVPAETRRVYPYTYQLRGALEELRQCTGLPRPLFAAAAEEAERIGGYLEAHATVPFRDAHLKNRVWATEESLEELVSRLLACDSAALRTEASERVIDLDFETTSCDVTEWDDVIHLLFFEMSGLTPITTAAAGVQVYERWWGPVRDREGLWLTVLARATRELCRRLWYARTMPNTYAHRYGRESRDFFLDLALTAVRSLDTYHRITDVLDAVRAGSMWAGVEPRVFPPFAEP